MFRFKLSFALLSVAVGVSVLWLAALLVGDGWTVLQSMPSEQTRALATWGWIGPLLCALPTVFRQSRRQD